MGAGNTQTDSVMHSWGLKKEIFLGSIRCLLQTETSPARWSSGTKLACMAIKQKRWRKRSRAHVFLVG
jgi:hypothetical protein